ncbi:MAG: carbohydrate-binding protein, partial [Calditrichaeota bacterium]
FKGIAKPDRVELSWSDNASNEQGFAIDRKHDIQSFAEIGRIGANKTTFIDSTVVSLKTYTYRIRAYNGAGSNMGLDFPVITTLGDGSSVRLEAEAYNKMSGIANNGTGIGSCDNGDYVMFAAFDFGPGFDLLTARCTVPAEYAGQKVLVKIDKRNGATIATLKVQNTGGWDNYQEQSAPMERVTGIHDLYFVFSGSSGIGNFDWFQFSRSSTVITQQDKRMLNFHLAQNYPNPFNPATTIDYQLPSACRVTLQVFDIRGRLVDTAVDRDQGAGHYSIQFSNPELASGAYFYQLSAGDFSARRKMLLIH